MKRYLSVGLILIMLLTLGASVVSAQTYLFQVERSSADIYISADGTASVEYTYVFVNDPSADPMEYVDVGMPTNNYSLSNVTADVDGAAITSIEESPYLPSLREQREGIHEKTRRPLGGSGADPPRPLRLRRPRVRG